MPPLRSGVLALVAALTLAPAALAQGAPTDDDDGPGVQFNGLGRAFIQQADLGGTIAEDDTSTARSLSDGEFVLDLAINAQPNRVTEVQGVLRLRNEFGGFFGSGVTVEVRELWARGIVANAVEYRLGDMDYALTPYTVYLPEADGVVNTPEVFEPLRQRVAYEEFYTGRNTRRVQGGHLDFGLSFSQVVESLDARAFLARLRPTDFTTTPTRLIGGGRLAATTSRLGPLASQARLGVNLANTWDDLDSGDANTGIRNHVLTVDGTLAILDRDDLALSLLGEGGQSIAKRSRQLDDGEMETDEELFRERDTFVELGVEAAFPERGITATAYVVDVGPDFFSAAAQSKRVDYTQSLSQFNRIGNDRMERTIGLFDLSRDPAVYTYRIEEQLMAYDPRYSNVMPYGRATPNRRGLRLDADYQPDESPVQAGVLVALLREIRGQGTEELKDFVLVRAEGNLAFGPALGIDRDIGLSLGLQFENTSRGGNEFETVDLTSFLIETGLNVEVYDRLDVLLGAKTRQSDGRDYVPDYANFNDVDDFPGPFDTDDAETLLGGGLRYRFADDVSLTLQYQHYWYGDDATPDDDFEVGQVFALYRMLF